MAEQEKYEPPKQTKSDKVHLAARAVLQTIPLAGGAAVEFFNAVMNPPLEKRRQKWMEEVAEGLQALETKQNVNLEKLSSNETFITTVMQASHVAIRNHQQEKLEALRNAVLNAALPVAPDDPLQQMFLNFVDIFSTCHIRLLKYADNPTAYAQTQGLSISGSPSQASANVLTKVFPEMNLKMYFYSQIWRDLYSHGLVSTSSLDVLESGAWSMSSRTTPLGKQFIDFISAPK
jgi:hypothetical protein